MGLAVTGPLRREVERALPSRPFALRFWDGTELPATDGGNNSDPARPAPTFTVRSPARSPTRCARPASSALAART